MRGAPCAHQDDDAIVVLKAVHLHKQLVDDRGRLVTAGLGPTSCTQGVKLVNKEDRRGVVPHLFKCLSNPPCAHAGVDVEKISS